MRCFLGTIVVLALLCGGCDVTFVRDQDAAAGDGGGGVLTCNSTQTICPSVPYGLCVEVQQSLGHCVDWRYSGASACTNGPGDCPASLPTANFPTGSAGSTVALCIKQSVAEFPGSATTPGSGGCAALQSAIDLTGQSTCTPNPCGLGGFCSYTVNQSGAAYVTCIWPI